MMFVDYFPSIGGDSEDAWRGFNMWQTFYNQTQSEVVLAL